jgi:hypothetical protein
LTGTVANARLTGSGAITINGTSIALGASGTIVAGLEWQAVKTANFNAASQEGYAVNTTSGPVVVTFPASPSVGDNIAIVDYAGTFNSQNCTINPNGKKIEGSLSNQVLQVNRVAINCTFIDDTQGWLVTGEGSSTPITAPTISWDTNSGTVGTITDAQRSGGYSLSSCGGSSNIGTPTFAVTSGALPTGLSLSSSGAISGTVTNSVGTNTVSNFTVTATISAYGYTETRAFSVQVNAPVISFTTSAGSIGTVEDSQRSNGSYSLSAVTATVTSGSLTYAVTSGALPGSVSLNSSTGAITGNFDAVGSNTTTAFTITATESTSSVTAAREFSITVNAPVNVSYILVAGGAGGGSGGFFGAGGGGAGGLLTGTISNASGSYSISIGGGGGGAGGTNRGGNGSNSSIGSEATAVGGGGGAAVSTGAGSTNRNGASGGSGGGGGHDGGAGSGGSGTSGQGNNGGNGVQGGGGGGGGGKGNPGDAASGNTGGIGGIGGQYSTVANATSSGDGGYYASGGSGGNQGVSRSGGGAGSGSSATANTGGGGGKQGNGGSGIAILYYTSGSQLGSGGTITNSGGVYYHKFTSGGTFSI